VLEARTLSWFELARRTSREVIDDDVLGLSAQLSYYFFLALFPAILFLLALAIFFPLSNITDDVAEIEHASPYGKAPGQKNAQGKLLLGARAARAYRQRVLSGQQGPATSASSTLPPRPNRGLGAAIAAAILLTKWWNRRGGIARPTEA